MEFAKLLLGTDRVPGGETLVGAYTTLGRAPGNTLILLDDQKVSRHHAAIRLHDGHYTLSDLGSANGTLLNGKRVLLPERLKHRDVVTIGTTAITFLHPPSERSRLIDDATGDFTMAIDAPSVDPVVVGTGEAMARVFALMQKAAASPIPVLIGGETGTGKELVARAIHHVSGRAGAPFIAVNCAALPEALLESQLFGHRRGSFTGADRDRTGLFEAADGGTVFLDEVGEMPLVVQSKFLRVLQEGEVVPLGDTKPRRVDVRVLSASNRDLRVEVEEHRFREDLFYRLSAFPILLPPLRERKDDVPLLTERFLAAAAHKHGKRVRGIEEAALSCLVAFDWPGNVRELQNEVMRAVAIADDGDSIRLRHLSPHLRAFATEEPVVPQLMPREGVLGDLRDARAAFEARYIADMLKEQGGNVSRAAERLGLSRMALHRKIKDYRLR